MSRNYNLGKSINIEEDLICRFSEQMNVFGIHLYSRNNSFDKEKCSAVICNYDSYKELLDLHSEISIYVTEKALDIHEGDIIRITVDGEFKVLYSQSSNDNVLFITENCNHRCIMCSQPPTKKNDLDYLFNLNSKVIDLISPECESLGITGGEPTLLGNRLFELYDHIADKLPDTIIHTLTNGRAFSSESFCKKILGTKNENLIFGIPLYSDYSSIHNYIVQSNNAFEQTIKGLYNLAKLNQRIEIRIVISKLNYSRLIETAHFIYRNLPFVDHVAFMGLEDIGNATKNSELVWIEPTDYIEELTSSVEYLVNFGMNVSLYNIPLCNLPSNMWQHSTKSISNWKTKYLDCCEECKLKDECCGTFNTSQKLSSTISPFRT